MLTSIPTMAAPTATPDTAFDALRAELEGMVNGWYGQHALTVVDLQTGQIISINGSRQQLAACTIKVGIMFAVAQDIEAGKYSEAEVAALVESAMGPSHTAPARELLRLVGDGDIGSGVQRVNQIMWDLGATNSILTHPPGYPHEEYGYGASHGIYDNLLTSDDMALLLGKLYRGEALSPWATGYVLRSLTIAPAWMNGSLGGPLPPEATLYHKVGQLYAPANTWNDAGVVVFERQGQPYAYAIAYLGSWDYSWENSYTHAADASAATWRYFSTK